MRRSQQGLQHAFDRFSVACDQVGTKISTRNIEVLFLTSKAVYSASEWKYTAAGGDVQAPCGGIHEWRKSEQKDNTRIVKANSVLCKLYCFMVRKRELWKTAKLSVCKGDFAPILTCGHETCSRSLLKDYCLKNKRQRWDFCEAFSLWHFVTKSTDLISVKPRIFNPLVWIERFQLCWFWQVSKCLREEWRTKYFGLQSKPTGKQTRIRIRTRWCDCISDLAGYRLDVEPAELSEIAVDREVFRVVLGLLPPQLSPKEKRARKWVNEWVCTPTLNLSGYENVFNLFTKSGCRIQII